LKGAVAAEERGGFVFKIDPLELLETVAGLGDMIIDCENRSSFSVWQLRRNLVLPRAASST
jgi:hypothetical protein